VPVARASFDVTIERPLAEVFAVVTDVRNTPRWSAPALEEELLTPGPVRVGSRRRAVAKFGPIRNENVAEVVEYEQHRRVAMRSVTSTVPFSVAMMFEPAGSDTTRVRFTWEFRPRGVMRVIDPMLGAMIRLQFPKDLATLKALIESGELGTNGRPGD
jgi:uncharacterized membrane protein